MSRPRVLVVGEGTPNFWHQIAIGFHGAGAHVSYVDVCDGLANMLVCNGAVFDLVVTNQRGIHEFAIPLRDDAVTDWKQHFKCFLMVQYHDAPREIPTLMQAGTILGWRSIRLAYFTYCRSTSDFLQRSNIYPDYLAGDLPIAYDYKLSLTEIGKSDFVDDIADALIPRNPPPTDAKERAFFPKILYIGAYYFGNTLYLRPGGPIATIEAFQHTLSQYYEQGRPLDRFGFIQDLLDRGVITSEHIINGTAAEYLNNYGGMIVLPNRWEYVNFVKKIYGPDFHLYGTDWQRFGFDSTSVDAIDADTKYRSAFISVDFGSTFIDTSVYQRIMQILASNGRLLQARQNDSAAVYGPFVDQVCFSSREELQQKLDAAFAAPAAFLEWQTAFAGYMRERHAPTTVCLPILRHLGLSV